MKNKWLSKRRIKQRDAFVDELYNILKDATNVSALYEDSFFATKWFNVLGAGTLDTKIITVSEEDVSISVIKDGSVIDTFSFNLGELTPEETASIVMFLWDGHA